MNNITIHGRLTRDPELITAQNGTEFCRFTVAVDRRTVKGKETQADFFNCTAFANQAVAASKFLAKGREVIVFGRMESNRKNIDGQTVTYWGITVDGFEFCGKKSDAPEPVPDEPKDADSGMAVVDTEELPF